MLVNQKHINIFYYTFLSLLRSWQKQVFLVLVYALIVAFYASIIFFTKSLQYETKQVLQHIPELWVQQLAGGRLVPMQENFTDSLKNIRGVQQVIPRIWGYNFDAPTGAVFTVIGSDSLTNDLHLVKGKTQTKLKNNQALCGTGFLELRGLKLGEQLTVLDNKGEIHSFEIVAQFEAESDLLSKDLIILSPKSAREVLGLNLNEVTDVSLKIANPNEVENIARKIDQNFAGVRVVTASQLSSTYQTLFGWRGGLFVYGTIIVIFAFLILAWERAVGFNSAEKQEIAVLKAVGWQIGDVLLMKFGQGLFVSLSATLLGTIIAYFHVFSLNAPLLKPFFIGWSVAYPSYNLYPVFDLGSFLLITAFSVIPYLSATLIPAWLGAITDPAEALQG